MIIAGDLWNTHRQSTLMLAHTHSQRRRKTTRRRRRWRNKVKKIVNVFSLILSYSLACHRIYGCCACSMLCAVCVQMLVNECVSVFIIFIFILVLFFTAFVAFTHFGCEQIIYSRRFFGWTQTHITETDWITEIVVCVALYGRQTTENCQKKIKKKNSQHDKEGHKLCVCLCLWYALGSRLAE